MTDRPNPYAAPAVEDDLDDALEAEPRKRLSDASLSTRFANLVIDSIFRMALLLAFAELNGGEDALLATLFFWFGYYVLFEWIFARTPAKWLTGTRVVDFDGQKPRFLRILGRTLARYVPLEPFSFLGSRPLGWHDRWSRTRVVSVRRR
jgi:uncharacterized RDD family membrane protein YckC